jgi:phage tail protein X
VPTEMVVEWPANPGLALEGAPAPEGTKVEALPVGAVVVHT